MVENKSKELIRGFLKVEKFSVFTLPSPLSIPPQTSASDPSSCSRWNAKENWEHEHSPKFDQLVLLSSRANFILSLFGLLCIRKIWIWSYVKKFPRLWENWMRKVSFFCAVICRKFVCVSVGGIIKVHVEMRVSMRTSQRVVWRVCVRWNAEFKYDDFFANFCGFRRWIFKLFVVNEYPNNNRWVYGLPCQKHKKFYSQ